MPRADKLVGRRSIPEAVEASLQLAGRVLEELDFPEGADRRDRIWRTRR